MTMPGCPPRSRSPRRSPKEAGEVGETVEDVIRRHNNPLASPVQLLRNLEQYNDVATPNLLDTAARLASAAMSPLPGRLTRSAAKESLQELVGVAKTRREKRAMRIAQEAARAAAAQAAHEREERRRLERARDARCERVRARRAAIGSRVPPTHREVDMLCRVHLS